MNMIGDFSSYTPWYVISSAKETYASFNLSSDCFKSFPSGHTNSAGCCYALLALPDLFEKFNNKKSKTILYISTVLYTALVGIYRIRVGAHFMSDVTIGGTLAYVSCQISRFIFITRKQKGVIQYEN
jgi:membrane-associated phospholipid phosphatase